MLFKKLPETLNQIKLKKETISFECMKKEITDVILAFSPQIVKDFYLNTLDLVKEMDSLIELVDKTIECINRFLRENQNSNIEIIHNNIIYSNYSSEFMVEKSLSYEQRIQLFETYIDNYISFD